jgi:hypothetical protein
MINNYLEREAATDKQKELPKGAVNIHVMMWLVALVALLHLQCTVHSIGPEAERNSRSRVQKANCQYANSLTGTKYTFFLKVIFILQWLFVPIIPCDVVRAVLTLSESAGTSSFICE